MKKSSFYDGLKVGQKDVEGTEEIFQKSAESCLLRQGQTINQAHYSEILMRLFQNMHRKRPKL